MIGCPQMWQGAFALRSRFHAISRTLFHAPALDLLAMWVGLLPVSLCMSSSAAGIPLAHDPAGAIKKEAGLVKDPPPLNSGGGKDLTSPPYIKEFVGDSYHFC